MIPYGFRISEGILVVDEEEAAHIRSLFAFYLSGYSIADAAVRAGVRLSRDAAGRILSNPTYVGDDNYPPIIDQATFDSAQRLRASRNRNAKTARQPVMMADNVKMRFRFEGVQSHIVSESTYDAVYQSILCGESIAMEASVDAARRLMLSILRH